MSHRILHSFDELGDTQPSKRSRIKAVRVEITISTDSKTFQRERNFAKEEYYNTKRAIKLYFDDSIGKFRFKVYNWDFDTYKVFCALDRFSQMRWVSINDAKALCAQWNRPMSKHYLFK